MEITRRLGKSPTERGCVNNGTCPDLFELSDGSWAVIGTDRTEELEGMLPKDAGRGPHERIIVITRETLIAARGDIPAV